MLGKTKIVMQVAAAALLLAGASDVALAKATAPAVAPDAMQLGGHPNFNGVWQVLNTADWDLEPHSAATNPTGERVLGALVAEPAGLGVVEGGSLPYKPEAKALKDQNKANAPGHDPEAMCYLPGIPRATYINLPFQIVQGDKGDLLFVYEYASANRVIHMGPVGVPPIDTWMGTSYGSWEGDTLKVVTLGQSPGDVKLPGGALEPGVTWLDRQGNYLTNTAAVTETFKFIDKDHIQYTATVDDPSVYSKPWTISMPLYRRVEANAQLLEFKCVPFSEMLLYGDLLENKPEKK
ncbi:MAG: hypothetical protein J7496_04875 [Novosphingobium sp.]|nr:hypothetical protein [Novosphingobium sp.]